MHKSMNSYIITSLFDMDLDEALQKIFVIPSYTKCPKMTQIMSFFYSFGQTKLFTGFMGFCQILEELKETQTN